MQAVKFGKKDGNVMFSKIGRPSLSHQRIYYMNVNYFKTQYYNLLCIFFTYVERKTISFYRKLSE